MFFTIRPYSRSLILLYCQYLYTPVPVPVCLGLVSTECETEASQTLSSSNCFPHSHRHHIMTVPQPPPQRPVATALPDAPPFDFFTPTQWDVLFALVDGVLPSITSESTVTDDQGQIQLPDHEIDNVLDSSTKSLAAPATRDNIRAFLQERPAYDARFRDNLMRTLALSPPAQQKRLAGLLSIMS